MFVTIYYPYLALIDSCIHMHFLNRVSDLFFGTSFEFLFFGMDGVCIILNETSLLLCFFWTNEHEIVPVSLINKEEEDFYHVIHDVKFVMHSRPTKRRLILWCLLCRVYKIHKICAIRIGINKLNRLPLPF